MVKKNYEHNLNKLTLKCVLIYGVDFYFECKEWILLKNKNAVSVVLLFESY